MIDGWKQTMPTAMLLSIALVAIAGLLVLILRFKLHPLLALSVTSIATAFATGIPVSAIMKVLEGGLAKTLGEVALLISFGAMFGRLAESSGAAQSLSDTMIRVFGEKRAPLALGVASLLFGFPIFFDAGLMVMLPIIFAVARKLGGSVLTYAIPSAAALSAMHVFLPPHPGAVASTVLLGGDIGLVIVIGLPVVVLTWFIAGYLYGIFIGKKIFIPVPDFLSGGKETERVENPPRPEIILALLFLPLVLILTNTALATLVKTGTLAKDNTYAALASVFGSTPIALLITLLVAIAVLGVRRGKSASVIEDLLDQALRPVAPVILITGAGGMFGGIFLASGIGGALSSVLGSIGLPLIVSVFIVAAILRIALGTATVAITTSAGLLGASVTAAALNPVQTTAVILALAAGSSIFPHVNDASFWMIGRILNMDVPTTFKTWSVTKTLISVVGFGFACLVFALGSAA